MKTRLLRKIRKRYSIDYWPNGYQDDYSTYPECMRLVDYNSPWHTREKILIIGDKVLKTDKIWTQELALTYLRGLLMVWIRNDYQSLGVRRNKLKRIKQKLWYV